MFLKKYFFTIIISLITIVTGFSQETNNDTENLRLPKSIYLLNISTETNSIINLNNKLNLNENKFAVLDINSIEKGYFSIPLKNISKQSEFVFETYKDLVDKRNLEKSFFKISKLYLPRNPKK